VSKAGVYDYDTTRDDCDTTRDVAGVYDYDTTRIRLRHNTWSSSTFLSQSVLHNLFLQVAKVLTKYACVPTHAYWAMLLLLQVARAHDKKVYVSKDKMSVGLAVLL
jgi:hypothetical protein